MLCRKKLAAMHLTPSTYVAPRFMQTAEASVRPGITSKTLREARGGGKMWRLRQDVIILVMTMYDLWFRASDLTI